MRILILSNSSEGLYQFRYELISELLDNHKVYISAPFGEYVDEFVKMNCNFIDTDISKHGTNPFEDIKLLNCYIKTIRRIKPDIIFTYTIKPNVYGGIAAQICSVPYVANITGLGSAIENGGILQKISLFLYRIGLKNAQKVFFQNVENQEFMLQTKTVSSNFDLLPGSGVNLEKFKLQAYPETLDFVFVARVMKEKGIDQYLEAAEYIGKRYPQTRFHICGSCEESYAEQIKSLSDNGVIIYHGNVKNMKEIYGMACCTVHPTYYAEGMSNVLLESSATGRPVITTDRSGCREIVDDGINGFIIKEKDCGDLTEKIEKFLSLSYDERKNMGISGRKKVEKEFDRNIVVKKYLDEVKN